MSNELYHYGIPGMRWGKRKKQLKQEYNNRTNKAWNDYDKAITRIEKGYKKGQNLSDKDLNREEAADKKYIIAISKAKADYKKGKANLKAEKKEFKSYMKKMNKHGLPGSIGDAGGESTKLYREIRAKKGKSYADSVKKSLSKKYTRDLIGSTVAAGALITAGIISAKRSNSKFNSIINNPSNFKNYRIR